MVQVPAHKDNKELRRIIRKKINLSFSDISTSPVNKDIINIVEDYYLPSIVYFFLESKQSNFRDYLNTLNLFSTQYIDISNRIRLLIQNLKEDGLLNSNKILGDIHPFSSTKALYSSNIQYKKYPDYYETLENILKEIIPDYKNFIPTVLKSKDDIIIREYITVNKSTEDKHIVEEYYYNLGRFIPILLLLRAIDINAENLLINLPYPIFFDLESIFSGEFEENIEEYNLRNTGIIKLSDTNDTSALSGGIGPRNSFLKPILFLYKGQPNIKWKIPSHGSYDNIPILKKKRVHPKEYIKSLTDGYKCSANSILDKREKLLNTLQKEDETYTRVILRPTRIYRLIILKSFYPQIYLNTNLDKFIQQELQKSSFIYKISNQSVELKESESLKNLLVPVFYSNIFSSEILYPDGSHVGKFHKTQYDIWKEYFTNTISKDFFIQQELLLTKSLEH